jgi:hypothetical protein
VLQQGTTKRIGYWFLHVHQLLEASMARALHAERLTRRQWQVLHTISVGAATRAEVDERLRPFLAADHVTSFGPVVDDFVQRGWVEADGDRITLNQAGVAAHERAERIVEAHAESVTRGITDEEFLAANDVLERMAGNLESGND